MSSPPSPKDETGVMLHARVIRPTALAAAAVGVMAVAACSTPIGYPGDELTNLPADAVGAVIVGPMGFESTTDKDRSLLFMFDAAGDVVGRLDGAAIHGSRVLAGNGRAVMSTASFVATLTASARSDHAIEGEWFVQAAAMTPGSTAATLWYNTGVVEDRYVNRYVSIGADDSVQTGQVEGIVGTSAYCGDRNFAVVRQSLVGTQTDATRNWLYELPADGVPIVRGQWDYDPEFRPVASTSPCSGDGTSILALYASEEAVTSSGNGPGLTLVRIDTANGRRTETQLSMPGRTWSTHRSSLTVVDDRLYWVTWNGEVLSVPLDGSPSVREEWRLPAGGDKVMLSVRDRIVSAVNYQDRAHFTRYDLLTGRPLHAPIQLPWLDDLYGKETEGGGTFYSIGDVVSLEH